VPRHCFEGMCVLSCASAVDCPESNCRGATCLLGMCAYAYLNDGVVCEHDGAIGACSTGRCVPSP
jgi:hypothetical protein